MKKRIKELENRLDKAHKESEDAIKHLMQMEIKRFELTIEDDQAERLITELKRIGFEPVNAETSDNLMNTVVDEDSEARNKVSKGTSE